VWFNNTAYPNEFYGPTGPEDSQVQAFTFLVRDQRLGVNTRKVIFGGETMCFWDLRAPWLEPLRGPNSGIVTEINAVNYVSARSRLATSQFVLRFFLFAGHLWHTGRAPQPQPNLKKELIVI
ncbi:hypothetical protein Goshw_024026, partial [Gossypium schwendimanii]|nr:hypothetical protein [Gossypium schwendimanii]